MGSANQQVRFETPLGTTTIGQVVSTIEDADPVSGPKTILVVAANGSQYRVAESDADPI